jgi:hypothetical protein
MHITRLTIDMPAIENINKLKVVLDAEQILQLESAALVHQQQSNITFTIINVSDDSIHIGVVQAENNSKKYATEATLMKRTHEVFDKWLPSIHLDIDATTALPSPVSIVTVQWLEKKMLDKSVRIKQIAFDTGVDRESIAQWVSGKRAMSQIVKAMLYFYLSK